MSAFEDIDVSKKKVKKVMEHCVLPAMTCGCQRAMERKMLSLKLQDKVASSEIRKRTKIVDSIECTLKRKWKWAGHIARMKDNRWRKLQPRREKKSSGRPSRK